MSTPDAGTPDHGVDPSRTPSGQSSASTQLQPTSHAPAAQPAGTFRRDALLGAGVAALATYSLRFLLVVAAVVVLALLVGQLWVIVLPVLLALLLATVLWPPVRVLRRLHVPAALAALLVIVLAVLLLVGLGVVLAPQVTEQAQPLADAVAGGLGDLQGLVTGPPLNLGQEQVGQAVNAVVIELQANAQNIATRVLSGVGAVGALLLNLVLAVVLCFFFLKDGPRFLPWLAALLGPRAAPHGLALAHRSWTTLGGFIRAQAAVGLADAVFIGVGLLILGVPLALPLSVLIFFGAFIPIIGAFVTGGLAALVALVTDGVTSALIVVGLVALVQQLEGNVLQPILVGRTLDLHPALVILAITAGSALAGIIGAFLAIPVVAVGAVAVRYVRQELDRDEQAEQAAPG